MLSDKELTRIALKMIDDFYDPNETYKYRVMGVGASPDALHRFAMECREIYNRRVMNDKAGS